MEADWEFEIGGEAAVIEAYWPGFVNLRDEPARVGEIAETEMLPGLAATLQYLNQPGSPVWSCKSDVFLPEQVDADELAASGDEAKFAIACYIDLLRRSDQAWLVPLKAEEDCRRLCERMREIPLRCCRVDLVVRRALVGGANELGITAYLTACRQTPMDANVRLAECLRAFAQLVAGAS